MTDLDLFAEFRPVEVNDYGSNRQYLLRFDNDYGASVITGYGPSHSPELAVIRWTEDTWVIDYGTPLTSDVIPLSHRPDELVAELRELLTQIRDLPPPTLALPAGKEAPAELPDPNIDPAFPADAGCWIDEANWGRFAPVQLVTLAYLRGFYLDREDNEIHDRLIEESRWGGEPATVDDWCALSDQGGIADEAEEWLNEHVAPEGYRFGWWDGSFYLQSEEWWEETADYFENHRNWA